MQGGFARGLVRGKRCLREARCVTPQDCLDHGWIAGADEFVQEGAEVPPKAGDESDELEEEDPDGLEDEYEDEDENDYGDNYFDNGEDDGGEGGDALGGGGDEGELGSPCRAANRLLIAFGCRWGDF